MKPKLRFREFRGEWQEKTLGDLVIQMQSGLSRKLNSKDIGLPVIRSNNIQSKSIDVSDISYWYKDDPQGAKTENYLLNDSDLLVNFINSQSQIGKFALYKDQLNRPAIFTTNIMRLKFVNKSAAEFVFYLFSSKKYHNFIQSITKPAVNQASFTTVDFKRFPLQLPPKDEQKKIAEFLGFVVEKIEKLQKKKELLEKYKKGTMRAIFSQKIRFKDENGKSYPDWEEKKLGDISLIISGQSPSGNSYNTNAKGLPLYQGKADFGSMFTAEPEVWTTETTKIAEPDDILISVRAPVGPTNFASQRMNIGRGLAAIRAWEGYIQIYIFYYLRFIEQQITAIGGGSTFGSINRKDIVDIKLPCPAEQEQLKIAGFLTSLDDKIILQESKLVQAKQFKKALLQQMFV